MKIMVSYYVTNISLSISYKFICVIQLIIMKKKPMGCNEMMTSFLMSWIVEGIVIGLEQV